MWPHYVHHTLHSAGDVTIPGNMTFTVDSDLNGESPQFTLTCTSTGGPATTVTWTRGSETVSGEMFSSTTVLDDPVTAQYTHTLTVTGRLGGQYQCTVSNNKPSSVTAELIIVTGSHILTNHCRNDIYRVFVICLHTDPLIIFLSPSTSSPTAGESISLSCSVTLPGTVSGSPVFQWAGPGDTPTPAAPSTSGQVVTSTLTLSAVRTSQAGQYTCTASLEGSTVSSTVDITVQSECTSV